MGRKAIVHDDTARQMGPYVFYVFVCDESGAVSGFRPTHGLRYRGTGRVDADAFPLTIEGDAFPLTKKLEETSCLITHLTAAAP